MSLPAIVPALPLLVLALWAIAHTGRRVTPQLRQLRYQLANSGPSIEVRYRVIDPFAPAPQPLALPRRARLRREPQPRSRPLRFRQQPSRAA